MRPHLRYLRYVLLHKWYVLRAGVALGTPPDIGRVRWLWRLLVHDLSKFSRAEWGPYVAMFYGPPPSQRAGSVVGTVDEIEREIAQRVTAEKRARQEAFDRAWLHHQHANPHHWQHWVLREDNGGTKVLLMPLALVDEMLADWIAAGSKILRGPSLRECLAETVRWYAANREKLVLRGAVRARIEAQLHRLVEGNGMLEEAMKQQQERSARETIVIPGRA